MNISDFFNSLPKNSSIVSKERLSKSFIGQLNSLLNSYSSTFQQLRGRAANPVQTAQLENVQIKLCQWLVKLEMLI
ncbi:MAG: hypothetical protein R2753_15260 [Chitinophagales bacterium]